jgi:hypothetical protein
MATSDSKGNLVFDHRTLRLIVGSIAFAFPFTVYTLASTITSSISASYYTNARDSFVGFLFVIGVLLLAYKGHKSTEAWVSIVGWVAAWVAALFPTTCDDCTADVKSFAHIGGAIVLFATTVYFCLVAFLRRVSEKLEKNDKLGNIESSKKVLEIVRFLQLAKNAVNEYGFKKAWMLEGKKIQRGLTYLVCGVLIAVIMVGLLFVSVMLPLPTKALKLTFYAETLALWLFGVAWMTASQFQFIRKIRLLLKLRRQVRPLVEQAA